MLQPSSHHIADSQMVHPEDTQDEKTQDTGLWRAQVYITGMISGNPDSLHLPKHRKALNLLT